MDITLEQIDEVMKRTNCSFEEGKTVLEKHNGNIVDSIVELEKTYGIKKDNTNTKCRNFFEKVKELIEKGFKTRFIVEKNKEIYINISVNLMILGAIFLNVFFLILIVGALFLGYKIRIKKAGGDNIWVTSEK